jgi:DNA-binding transcriptional ArsR family regulator
MYEGPDISRIAHLVGDPARASMLTALLDQPALTASELAARAGITKQTASAHLAKLLDGGLLAVEAQGRHRYFRLDGADVASVLELLMTVAEKRTGKRARVGPKDPALRKARACYGHLAGELGVHFYDRLLARGWLSKGSGDLLLTRRGERALTDFGVDVGGARSRRALCRACLDWSERRHHLAGALGDACLARMLDLGWAKRVKGTRIIAFSPKGEKALVAMLS